MLPTDKLIKIIEGFPVVVRLFRCWCTKEVLKLTPAGRICCALSRDSTSLLVKKILVAWNNISISKIRVAFVKRPSGEINCWRCPPSGNKLSLKVKSTNNFDCECAYYLVVNIFGYNGRMLRPAKAKKEANRSTSYSPKHQTVREPLRPRCWASQEVIRSASKIQKDECQWATNHLSDIINSLNELQTGRTEVPFPLGWWLFQNYENRHFERYWLKAFGHI